MITSNKKIDKQVCDLLKSCANAGATGSGIDREKAARLLSDFCNTFSDTETVDIIKKLSNFYQSRRRMSQIGQEVDFPIEEILKLGRFGFTDTVMFAFGENRKAFESLTLDKILTGGVPSKAIASLAKGKKEPLPAALDFFVKNPSAADHSSAADWVFESSTPKQLLPFLHLLFSKRERSPHLKPYSDLASICLEKDKSAILLKGCIEEISKGTIDPQILLRIFLSQPKTAENFISFCGNQDFGDKSSLVFNILEGIIRNLPSFNHQIRSRISVCVAALGSRVLLQKKRPSNFERLLDLIHLAGSEMSEAPCEEGSESWALLDLSRIKFKNQNIAEKSLISFEGAQFYADLLQEENMDPKLLEALHTVAFNLGIKRVGLENEILSFNPVLHEDTVGGLFRDDRVTVVSRGWSLGDRALVRAKVKPCND